MVHLKNKQLVEAALLGLEMRRKELDHQILEVRSRLGNGHRSRAWAGTKNGHRISAAGRRRIALAQKRRWAEYRKSAGKS